MRPGSRQALDQAMRQNNRMLLSDPLWMYAYEQAYFRFCEKYHFFPNRKRVNNSELA